MTTTSQTTIEQRRALVLASSAAATYLASHTAGPSFVALATYVGQLSTQAAVAVYADLLPSDLLAADAALHATAPAYA